jgi:hypothetical protein
MSNDDHRRKKIAVREREKFRNLSGCRVLPARLTLEIDVGERVPVGVADDEAILAQLYVRVIDGPRRRKASAFRRDWVRRRPTVAPVLSELGQPRREIRTLCAVTVGRPAFLARSTQSDASGLVAREEVRRRATATQQAFQMRLIKGGASVFLDRPGRREVASGHAAGWHRLEAVRKLGHATIFAGVVKECGSSTARRDRRESNSRRAVTRRAGRPCCCPQGSL